ncbi:MAG TPA: endolytic transglycosylase MltG, partial [Coxiellaceae bacterium]|nr:endolytic transglycosylase MltG [Coxiellaceae bacterium]
MFRTLWRLVLLFLVILIVLGSLIVYQFFSKPMLAHPPATSIIIKPGSSLNTITRQLNAEGLLRYPPLFMAWAIFLHKESSLKAGEYAIDPTMTAPQLLANMVNGKFILHKLTLVEGWTFNDFRQILNKDAFLQHDTTNLSDNEVLQLLGSGFKSPEGLFFPETYLFTRGDSDVEILKMAYAKMQDMLNFQWQARSVGLPYLDLYQALIVASMIEKET